MIAIVDYGVGNLFSLKSSFSFIGEDVVVTGDADTIRKSDKIILPGVGAFEDAARKLKESGLGTVVMEEAKKGKPLLGICLGMQLLFEKSYEFGTHEGLGLIKGEIIPIKNTTGTLKIPHMGWNNLIFPKNRPVCPIFKYIKEGDSVYFVHSFYGANCDESVAALAEYGELLTAAVWDGNVYGTQFHPEKSGKVGLNILKAFCEL
ncbi:MAG: imidazole glycerol phosphate synthase subunit HisH [Firmicutes bacterium]|nr:imidazole glycerol phosphate synthase subunit HisH [Bacillota bacterium]